jgi:hypothetical protein
MTGETVSQDLSFLKSLLEKIGDSEAGILQHIDPITSLQNKFTEMQAMIQARAGSIDNVDSIIGSFF